MVENIFGTDIDIPQLQSDGFIEDWGYPNNSKQQYWRKLSLPSFFEKVEYDKDGNALLNTEQRDYATTEVKRCKNGFFFLNNGQITYITGKNYFYLQWWKLEDSIYPDYRDLDRRYFTFLNYWENVSWCLFIVIGKMRRRGATSIATSNLIYECIFFKNSNCGFTSKTLLDAKSAFTNMISFGYRQLPVFLKPKQLNNKDSVTELVFAHKSVDVKSSTGNVIDDDTGHRSRIDYRAPSANVFDGSRLSRACLDEGAKFPKDVPFSKLISIISKTLVKGARRVGFLECPSTTNSMTEGGEEFKIVWENANQFIHSKTPNRGVKFFTPAYEGYLGFINKYGISVVDPPNEEDYKYLVENFVGAGDLTEEDIKLGAKEYLLNKRKQLSSAALEEEIRMFPFSEEEMFMYAGQSCEFNSENIQNQIKYCKDNPDECYWRKARLILKKETIKSIFPNGKDKVKRSIDWMDDANGLWEILEVPNKPNHFKENGFDLMPLNKAMYQIGVDPTKGIESKDGSNQAVVVFKKSCIVTIDGDKVETGLYPVAILNKPTRMDVHLDEEILKACLYYGATVNYEIDLGVGFWRFFQKQNCGDFLEWTPKILMNPLKPNKAREPGTRSGDPFQLSQMLQISKWYIDGDSNTEYNGHVQRIKHIGLLEQALKYDHSDRTKSDLFVALQMALAPVFGEVQSPIIPTHIQKLLPTYKIQKYG